jgi:hypothetical protein
MAAQNDQRQSQGTLRGEFQVKRQVRDLILARSDNYLVVSSQVEELEILLERSQAEPLLMK